MNEQNKDVQNSGTRETKNAVPTAAPAFSWKRLLGKKWVFPAVYMAAAAIILTLMWVYQDASNTKVSEDSAINQTVTDSVNKPDKNDMPVAAVVETMQWPVAESNEVEPIMPFYDEKAEESVKQTALIEYGETFTPHLGIDLVRNDGKEFDVLAAMSGTVTLVEKNPMVGYQVEITHANGLVTSYQSLSDVKVQKDQNIKKGDVIAKAGRNEVEKDNGIHLHFEVRKGADGEAVNPNDYLAAADSASTSQKKQ